MEPVATSLGEMFVPGVAGTLPMRRPNALPKTRYAITATSVDTLRWCADPQPKSEESRQAQMQLRVPS